LWPVLFLLLPAVLPAQSAVRRASVLLEGHECPKAGFYFRDDWPAFCGGTVGRQAFQSQSRSYRLLLPAWSADDLPFFCRIEHQWGRRHRVPVKFRLGSVDYVDWLEGKRDY